jgi:hypothetical protein
MGAQNTDRHRQETRVRHTRDHNTAKAIAAEHRLNEDHVAECDKPAPF